MPENNAAQREGSLKRRIAVLWSGNLIAPFLLSGVAAMLPAMGADLGASAVELSLVMVCYNLGQFLAQLLGGRLGASYGLARVLKASMLAFAISCALMAAAPFMWSVISLRFVQGLAAGSISCCVTALSVIIAPPEQRGRVLGTVLTSVYLGLTTGPFACGTITDLAGWRFVLALLAVSGLLLHFLLRRNLPPDSRNGDRRPPDPLCTLLLVCGTALLAFGCSLHCISPLMTVAAVLGVMVLAAYLRAEWRSPHPLLNLRILFKAPGLPSGLAAMFANYGSVMGLSLFFSLYLQQVLGYSAMAAGLMLMTQSFFQMALSPFAGRIGDRLGHARVALAGLVVSACGLACLFLLDGGTSPWTIAAVQAVLGTGAALFAAPNMISCMKNVPRPDLPVAAGLTGAMRCFGGLASNVVLSAVMAAFMGTAAITPGTSGLFMASMHATFAVYLASTLAGIALCAAGILRHRVS